MWHRVLHDRTAEALLAELARLPHANVTTVPFQLDARRPDHTVDIDGEAVRAILPRAGVHLVQDRAPRHETTALTSLADARWRDRVRVGGRVSSLRVLSQHDSPTLELVITDGTGALSLVFLGRRDIAGITVGTHLEATATVGVFQNRLAMLNPTYELRPR
jgi:RecG-like helicase